MAQYIRVDVSVTVKIRDPNDPLLVNEVKEVASENLHNLLPGYEITDTECHAGVVDAD